MGKTIAAMQRVQEIKEVREQRFYNNRLKDAAGLKKAQARVELEKGIELIAPAAGSREKVMQAVVEKTKARVATKKMAAQKMARTGGKDGMK